MEVPIIIMEWMPMWHHWNNKWYDFFPENQYGITNVDTHIYDFKDTIEEAEKAWDKTKWPSVKNIASQVHLMVGEYTLALNKDLPT